MSPEVFRLEQVTPKTDIWSLGCLIYELCTLKKPFNGNNAIAVRKQVLEYEPELTGPYSTQLLSLIKKMLSKNPFDRPSAEEILRMNLLDINSAEVKLLLPEHIGKATRATTNKLA